jgi:RNA polymerase sigma-70 factor, ECF subfamily
MHETTFTEIERLGNAVDTLDIAFQMDEDTFRAFYDRTARSLWVYLSRATGDNRLAEDLLQEAYYRLLRTGRQYDDEAHRRHYLFRIGINLVRDHQRRPRVEQAGRLPEAGERHHPQSHSGDEAAERTVRRIDLGRAMARLSRRERDLLWLAYAQGSSHDEIAVMLGLKTASIKSLLFRARRRLAALLGGGAPAPRSTKTRGDAS